MKKIMLFSALFFCLFIPFSTNAQLTKPEFSNWTNVIESTWFDDSPGVPMLIVYTAITSESSLPPFIDTLALSWEYSSNMVVENGVLGGWIYKNSQHYYQDVAKSGAWATWTYNNQQQIWQTAGIVTKANHVRTSVVKDKLVLSIYLSKSQLEYLKCAKALPPTSKAFNPTPDVFLYD